MDDQGRGYRGAAVRCSGCGGDMTEWPLEESAVDVCEACGGLWLDWFDGEPSTLAIQVAPMPIITDAPPAASRQACPRCSTLLGPERLLGAGPEVLRCGDCSGIFVPRGSFEGLLEIGEETPPESVREQPWLFALIARLRRALDTPLFGGRQG